VSAPPGFSVSKWSAINGLQSRRGHDIILPPPLAAYAAAADIPSLASLHPILKKLHIHVCAVFTCIEMSSQLAGASVDMQNCTWGHGAASSRGAWHETANAFQNQGQSVPTHLHAFAALLQWPLLRPSLP